MAKGKNGFASHPDLAKYWGKINGRRYKRGKSKSIKAENSKYTGEVNEDPKS